MRKTLKKALALVTALAVTFGMSSLVSAADDIVLDGAGDPAAALAKTIDPGEGEGYQYIGWAYAGSEVSSDYKYLKITYHGDATSLEEIRLELVQPDGNPDGPGITNGIRWFSENEEGSLLTVDGKLAPAPTDKDQTVVIDLEKSGYDLSKGLRAFHIHSTKGKGVLTITDARLMTSPDGSAGGSSTETDKDTEADKDTEDATKNVKEPTGGETTSGGSVEAPKTGSNTWPIAVAVGGIVVAGVAFMASKKLKED